MTYQITAVLATPPSLNSGMAAVELALHAFIYDQGLSAEVARIINTSRRFNENPISSNISRHTNLFLDNDFPYPRLTDWSSSGKILFWGDFLHNAPYIRVIAGVLAKLNNSDYFMEIRKARELFLLEGCDPSVMARSVSFGTTLLMNCGSDGLDAGYNGPFNTFIRNIGSIWVRDVISASKVAIEKSSFDKAFWGCDCAQLLGIQSLERYSIYAKEPDWADCRAGVFFGRTHHDLETAARFVKDVCEDLKTEACWVPWGDDIAFPQLYEHSIHAKGFKSLKNSPSDLSMILGLRKLDFIFTDTYHLAVIAWSFGIPAVMFHASNKNSLIGVVNGVIDEWKDKRAVFYIQYQADEYLVDLNEMRDDETRGVSFARIIMALNNSLLTKRVVEAMRAHVKASYDALVNDLFG